MGMNDIKLRVEDLVIKGQGGYISGDNFNRDFADAQNVLLSYYIRRYEQSQEVSDALLPFLSEAILTIGNNGYIDLPENYRHRVSVSKRVLSQDENKKVVQSFIKSTYVHPLHLQDTLMSVVRKPNVLKKRYVHTFSDGRIRFFPNDMAGSVKLVYFIQAPEARWGYVTNQNTITEDYDVNTTIEHVWPEQEEINLIALMLHYKGIQIRDNEVIQWLQVHKAEK